MAQSSSFKAEKVLLYRENFDGIINKKLLPPIEVNIDPINACNLRCKWCFDGNEKITMFDFSTKKISDLLVNDYILGIKNGKICKNKILKIYNNGQCNEMLEFTFEDKDKFLCTSEHRIWDSRGRYKEAKNFKVGNYVKKAFRFNRNIDNIVEYKKGYIAKIQKTLNQKVCIKKKIINIERKKGCFDKYDIETEFGNYLIKGVLVHNCNAHRVLDNKIMAIKDLLALINDLADWGVKGICFAGGGEPTLHPSLEEAIKLCTQKGLDSAIITNGFNLSNSLIETIVKNMKWIGISVDAGSKETFKNCKGVDGFEKVIDNIKKLVEAKKKFKSDIGITFKYLIHKLNQYDLIEAYKIAKKIGCDSLHLRPVDWLAFQDKEDKLDIDVIEGQINEIKELNENSQFEFIPYFVNFNNKLKRKIEFKKCELSPLLAICMPDGWWICIDRKGVKKLWMCKVEDIRKFWGSKKHFQLLDKINPEKECGKCTLNKYYPYFENYKQDKYYWKFV